MGNGCCPFARTGLDSVILKTRSSERRRHRNRSDEAMNGAEEEKEDKFVKYGPMLLKEPTKVALLVSTVVDDVFYEIQNTLAKQGWQSGVAATEEEAEERFCKLWPHLVVIDGRKVKRKSYTTEHVMKKLRTASDEDGSVIFVIFDKLPDEKRQRDLIDAGASKLIKYCIKNFLDELHWMEHVMLPNQLRIRASSALFTALEHCDNAIEITDYDKIVQFVNSAYEQLTGCHKSEVLGTLSSDLRRKSLPKELPLNNPKDHLTEDSASSTTDSATVRPINDHGFGWRSFSVPSTTSHVCAQFVHLKQSPTAYDANKPFNGFYRRPPSLRHRTSAVDTPVSEILSLLKDVQRKCEHDEEIQKPIQKVVKILNSTELYSPLITRFKQEDKVSSDLFGGLVLNGPMAPISRTRKTSLSEAMRSDKHILRQSSGLLNRIAPDVRALLQLEETWQFDVFELERVTFKKPLVHLGMKIFQRWKVREFLQCTDSCLRSWLELIEAHYHADNPYHNSSHAADVLQATVYYLGTDKIANMIEHSDAVAAILAAIVHDVDHPGKGSPFLINTKHPLALFYNDVSVLESHHAALAYQLTLSDPRYNIFARLSRQDYNSLRKIVVDMVLATDMNKHFEYLAKFQTTILATDNAECNGDSDSNKDRLDPRRIVCRILIKCADVSNPTRPWKLCKEWAYRICEEYFAQTAEEKAKGLPLTMEVLDRDTCNVPLTQCSFIDMFIREMFKGWCGFGNMPNIMTQIEENYLHWQEENKIWPQQRDEEYAKVQKYISSVHHEPLRSQGSRLSIDVPINVIEAATYYLNQPPPTDHDEQHHQQQQQQQQQQQNSRCTDL